ncbi:hypothetical protein ABH931_004784 [Streptacidiphilus sp. MAP12-33]|uniref:hypothetical protein n=1 Tax=Streptacidiphilus sp. MAP12-33 TaxID=3156266 RepID=UPI003513379C
MVLDASTLAVPKVSSPAVIPAWPAPGERQAWLDGLNLALRRPDEYGGLEAVARLLDRLAASEPPSPDGAVWLPDTLARMSTAGLLRQAFPDPELHVVVAQYAEDAHRRGWLRVDRTLAPAEHADLVGALRDWMREDRTFPEVVARFGDPSVVHGPAEPDRPKTLTYVTTDRQAPVVTFHLAADPAAGPAVVLAARIDENILGGWDLTPYGEKLFTEE